MDLARFEDIAYKVLMGSGLQEIAHDLKMSERQVRRFLHDPRMGDVYRAVHSRFYTDLNKVLLDERVQPLVRAHAQAIRAQTLISEIMEEVRERIDDGRAKATDLKVGADAAFGIMDRAKGDLSASPATTAAGNTQINFQIGAGRADFIKGVIAESGLDLSDVIDVTPQEPPDATPTKDPA